MCFPVVGAGSTSAARMGNPEEGVEFLSLVAPASGELQADIYVQGSTQRVLNVTLNGMAVGSIVCTERDFSYSFRLHSDCPGRVAITALDAQGLTLYATIILTPYRV